MNQEELWSLICKYLAGESTIEETEQMQKWLSEDPSNQNIVNDVRNIWEPSNFLKNDPVYNHLDLEKEWARMQEKMNSPKSTRKSVIHYNYNNQPHLRSGNKKSASYIWQFSRIAALILIMFGGAILLSRYYGSFDQNISVSEPQFREISTRPRQLAGITLTDGSKVNLSVESMVRLSENFNREIREVFLEGQAYFDVIPDLNMPFVVKTKHTNLKVLGTDFTVRAYPDDEKVQVAVASGSVSMESERNLDNSIVIIASGELGSLDIETGIIEVKPIDTEDYLGWLDGRLVFKDAKLGEVVRDLQRWFEIDIEIGDESLESRRLTAILNNRSLLNVLDVLSVTLDISYQLEDDEKRVVFNKGS